MALGKELTPSTTLNFLAYEDQLTAFRRLQCGSQPSISEDYSYLRPLRELATEFGHEALGEYGLDNALALSKGCYRDLVVVLQEPTDGASYRPPEEMFEGSATLKWIDDVLWASSGGCRSWTNTRIFDIRPFRNRAWREADRKERREELDERAYEKFEEMVRLAKPDVILVCQCQTDNAANTVANELSSSVKSIGRVRILEPEILGRKTLVVNGCHPSYILKYLRDEHADEMESQSIQSDCYCQYCATDGLLWFAFLVAINATARREITGSGRDVLSHYASGRGKSIMTKNNFPPPRRMEKSVVSQFWQDISRTLLRTLYYADICKERC